MSVSIRLFDAAACPAAVFRLRYEIYVEELNRTQLYACRETRTIRDPLDEFAHHAVAFDGEQAVGCVRINFAREGDLGRYLDLYEIAKLTAAARETACICTRNMVRAGYRKTGVSVRMLKEIYKFGMESGMTACFMDVNPPLEGLFEKFGYKFLFRKEHPEYGLVSVHRLDVLDLAHLKSVRSPFAPLCEAHLARAASLAPA
jgi:GNAT superfamily N-acetyltransferase